jgi:type IV secretion system protein TrbL
VVNLFLFFQVGTPNIGDPSNFTAAYEALVPKWIAAVFPYAQDLFWALAGLDLAVFGWTLIRRHGNNLPGAILSTANRVVMIGAFLALLMNGPVWMGNIIQMFIDVGKAGSGVPVIQPSVVMQQGLSISFSLLGQSVLTGILQEPITALSMVLAAFVIASSFFVVTVDFVLTKIQTFLALGMGFFFLGFGGSGWTRNYVERYFAYAVSSGVRLMANYFIIGTGLVLSKVWQAQSKAAPWSFDGVKQAWIIMFGAALFGVLAWKGSAMAASLLGGGPNLSHNEVFHAIGAAAQAGIAAALIASGVGSAAGGAAASGAGAAAGGGGAAAGAAAGGKGAAAATSGAATPASKPPRSGSNGANAYQAASATVGAIHSAGGGGSHQVHPPSFRGFGSDE